MKRTADFKTGHVAASVVAFAACMLTARASVTIDTFPTTINNGETADVVLSVSSEREVVQVSVEYMYTSDYDTVYSFDLIPTGNAGKYAGEIPILPAGELLWYGVAYFDGGDYEISDAKTVTISSVLNTDRFTQMIGTTNGGQATNAVDAVYGWHQVTGGGGTNFVASTPNGGQWTASGVGWAGGTARANRIPQNLTSLVKNVGVGLSYPVLFFLNLDPDLKPHIMSPKLENGLGTFSFGIRNMEGTTSEITLQVARTQNEPGEGDWSDVEVFHLTNANTNSWFTNIINDASITYARLIRTMNHTGSTSVVTGLIGIDDICITPPTPDVTLQERLRNPGYPAAGQDIAVRCMVSNVYERIPAINRTVSVSYALAESERSAVSSWSSTNLTYSCETNGCSLYVGTIPAQDSAGWLHYYFQCDFEGYYYISPEANGMATPEYLYGDGDSGVTAHIAPDATSTHRVSEVRASKSRYSTMQVMQRIDGRAPEYYTMTLVDDNLWQVSTPVEKDKLVEAYFVGTQCYEDDADSFLSSPAIHGHLNTDDDHRQATPYKTPTGGSPDRLFGWDKTNQLASIRFEEIASDGFMVYRFDDSAIEDELNYTIRRGVFQNFDDWEVASTAYVSSLYGAGVGTREATFDDWGQPYAWPAVETSIEDFLGAASNTAYRIYKDIAPRQAEFVEDDATTPLDWTMKNFRLTTERVTNNAAIFIDRQGDYVGNSNIVAQIAPGGGIRNGGNSIPRGIGEISTRVRSAVADRAIARYTGAKWRYSSSNPLNISTSFAIPANERANSHYYASVVFDYLNPTNYHELRFVRADATSASDNRLQLELYETYNGETTCLGTNKTVYANDNVKAETTIEIAMQVSLPSANRITVQLTTVKFGNSSYSSWVGANNAFANVQSKVNGADNGGHVGFSAYDCAPKFNYLKISGVSVEGSSGYSAGSNTAVAQSTVTETFEASKVNWEFGGTDYTTGNTDDNKWYLDSGLVLRRRIPRKTIRLYITPEGEDLGTVYTNMTVQSLQYQTLSCSSFHAWNAYQAHFTVAGDDGDNNCVVFDSVSVTPWRGATRTHDTHYSTEAFGYESDEDQDAFATTESSNWIIFEGWAMTNTAAYPRSVAAAFQYSQANSNLVQALYSPVMTNGLATVKFNYHVTGTPGEKVVYAVEYTQDPLVGEMTFHRGYETAATYTNTVANGAGYHSCDVSVRYDAEDPEDPPGKMRFRIRVLPPEYGTSREATLWLDDVYANDFPRETPTMWKAYNGRLASADEDRDRVYGKAGRTLFLNYSTWIDIDPSRGIQNPFDEWRPYLQAPQMAEGIGEIAFTYRTFDATSNSQTGKVSIAVSNDKDKPFDQWLVVTNLYVADAGYISFDNPDIYEKTNTFVRIFTETNGYYGRVCLDNIVIMEPSRPGYDISSVWLMPEQPILSQSNVAVRAAIDRLTQKPTDIRLFVSWVATDSVSNWEGQTGSWGYSNWWRPRYENRIGCVELHQVGTSRTYETAEGEGLPSDTVNGVVQYVVWGVHNKVPPEGTYTFDDVIFQNSSCFTNPARYGRVDLNKSFAESDETATFSPYYFIYSCAPGSVWFNEIWNHVTSSGTMGFKTYNDGRTAYEFVELAGKAGIDISHWTLNVYVSGSTNLTQNKNNRSITFPSGTTIPNKHNGWGFILIGDAGMTNSAGNVIVDIPIEGTQGAKVDSFNNTSSVAFELLRDGGIIEQAVYLKSSKGSGSYPWEAPDDPDAISRLISLPWKNNNNNAKGRSYSLLDEVSEEQRGVFPASTSRTSYDPQISYTNEVAGSPGIPREWWWYPATPTPGEINDGQSFTPLYADYFLLDSSITGGIGTQNGQTHDILVNVESGASTSIVYVAGSWYKIVALESNGASIDAAIGQSSYTFPVSSMSGDIVNSVTFGPKTDDVDYDGDPSHSRWTEEIISWFRRNGWTESQIAAGDADPYSVWEEYLMDTDPTVDTEVDNSTASIDVAGGNVSLGIRLARTENGAAVRNGINGAVNIYGVPDLAGIGTAAETKAATLGAGSFSGADEVEASIDAEALGLNFFFWRLEEE